MTSGSSKRYPATINIIIPLGVSVDEGLQILQQIDENGGNGAGLPDYAPFTIGGVDRMKRTVTINTAPGNVEKLKDSLPVYISTRAEDLV
jgi:hypothetical protein